MSDKILKVQIPEELAFYVMEETAYCGRYVKKRKRGNTTHHLAKVIGFFLLLKAESPGAGLIQGYTKQLAALAQKFHISPRTFYSYVLQLEDMKLITRTDGSLHVASWKSISKILTINTKKRKTIQYNYEEKQKIHWWFAALEIKSNQELQADAVWKKVNKNSAIAGVLQEALIARGFDLTRANNPEYYAGQMFLLNVEDFKTGTEVHDILINIRSDVNRSCKKIAESWNMSPQLVSYWKKQMKKNRVIEVSKLTVTSQYSAATKECHKNKHCHIIWNEKIKERVWFLCDQISILMPWEWTAWLEKNMAA